MINLFPSRVWNRKATTYFSSPKIQPRPPSYRRKEKKRPGIEGEKRLNKVKKSDNFFADKKNTEGSEIPKSLV